MIHIRYFLLGSSVYSASSKGYPIVAIHPTAERFLIRKPGFRYAGIRGNSHPAVWLLPVLYEP